MEFRKLIVRPKIRLMSGEFLPEFVLRDQPGTLSIEYQKLIKVPKLQQTQIYEESEFDDEQIYAQVKC